MKKPDSYLKQEFPNVTQSQEIMDRTYLDQVLTSTSAGDHQAFSRLFDIFYLKVYRFTSYFIRSREDREEVVSEVFKTIWQNKHLLIGIQNFESYLYVVTRNESFKMLRACNKYRYTSIDDMPVDLFIPEETSEGKLIDREMHDIYTEALNELPERCKLIFLMVREERLKYKEVAEILSIAEGTVERQINIATKKMVEAVRKRMPGFSLRKKIKKDCG